MNPSKPAYDFFGRQRRGLAGAAATILKRLAPFAILAGCSLAAPSLARAQQRPAPAPTAPQVQPSGESGGTPQPGPAPTPAPTGEPAPAPNGEAAPQAEPAPAPAPAPQATVESRIRPAPPPPPVVRKVTTPIVVSGILSGIALGTGVFFAIDAVGKHSDYEQKPDHKVGVAGERSAFIADVSFGIAALFGLTALAMYFLPDEPAASAAPAAAEGPSRPSWIGSALKGEVLRF
jgi:hypothetical protein